MEAISLENWSILNIEGRVSLIGNAWGHPRFSQGHPIQTSPVMQVWTEGENTYVKTKSGSLYHLGVSDPEFIKHHPNPVARLALMVT